MATAAAGGGQLGSPDGARPRWRCWRPGCATGSRPSAPLALWGVVVLLVVNWFGDSLDGTLARVRHQERPRYGFYVDHVLDAVGILFLIGGLMLGGFMSLAIGGRRSSSRTTC